MKKKIAGILPAIALLTGCEAAPTTIPATTNLDIETIVQQSVAEAIAQYEEIQKENVNQGIAGTEKHDDRISRKTYVVIVILPDIPPCNSDDSYKNACCIRPSESSRRFHATKGTPAIEEGKSRECPERKAQIILHKANQEGSFSCILSWACFAISGSSL